jgi:hypothetical protein
MLDHVAYQLTDHDGLRRKLDGLSIPYSRMELPELGERRLFVKTPTGIFSATVQLPQPPPPIRLHDNVDCVFLYSAVPQPGFLRRVLAAFTNL